MSYKKHAKLKDAAERRGKRLRDQSFVTVNKRSALCERVRMLVAFNGAKFHGWMRQGSQGNEGELRTIQGVLEEALRFLLGQWICQILPAGRTDAGVSALAMHCQFEAILG